MMQHISDWISAYHDGELRGARLQAVEAHLQDCAACRAELETLRRLSALLLGNPVAASQNSPDSFVAQVGLRLQGRPALPASHNSRSPVGWLAPLIVVGLWAFGQAVLLLSQWLLVFWQPGVSILPVLFLKAGFTLFVGVLLWGWLAGWVVYQRWQFSQALEM